MKHCTEADCQKVLDFVVAFSRMLGLPHCWVSINSKPAPRGYHAMIDHEEQRHYARIRLGRQWSDLTEFERFHTAVHETLHLIHRRVETVAIAETRDLMHDHEHAALQRNFNREVELMVDQMALAWCHIAEVRALWYGEGEGPIVDPEAGRVQ